MNDVDIILKAVDDARRRRRDMIVDILKAIDDGCRKRRDIVSYVSRVTREVRLDMRQMANDGLIEYRIYWGPTGWYLTARGQRALVHALTT